MEVIHKDCGTCSHRNICSIKEQYDKIVGEIIVKCDEIEYSDANFRASVTCKHFDETKPTWR